MSAYRRMLRVLVLATLSLALVVAGPPPASAEPTIEEQVEEFSRRIDLLGRNLEIASEELNSVRARSDEIKKRISELEDQLERTRAEYQLYRTSLDRRLRATYRIGPLSYIELVLGSRDIPSLVNVYETIMRIEEKDRSDAAELIARKEQLEVELVELRRQELEAVSLELELSSREYELEQLKTDYETLLSQTSSQVVTAYRTQTDQQRLADAQALQNLLATGYVVEPGGVVETALAYRGIPYVWGGESKSGMDCSGLVLFVFKQHGVNLPHYSRAQFGIGQSIPVSLLEPGDVVFFGSPIHHVGIYVGGGFFIHAPTFGDVVKVSRLSAMSNYAGARRYDWTPRTQPPL